MHPQVEPRAPDASALTAYDRAHLLTYARLLSADDAEARWEDVAAEVLGLDVAADREAAETCFVSHVARAQWVATEGYALALGGAAAAGSR